MRCALQFPKKERCYRAGSGCGSGGGLEIRGTGRTREAEVVLGYGGWGGEAGEKRGSGLWARMVHGQIQQSVGNCGAIVEQLWSDAAAGGGMEVFAASPGRGRGRSRSRSGYRQTRGRDIGIGRPHIDNIAPHPTLQCTYTTPTTDTYTLTRGCGCACKRHLVEGQSGLIRQRMSASPVCFELEIFATLGCAPVPDHANSAARRRGGH